MQYNEIVERAMERIAGSQVNEGWFNLGCETQSQNRLNREYMDRIVFETRLIEAVWAETRTELFGCRISTPVIGSVLSPGRVLENLTHSSTPWFESPAYTEHMADALGTVGTMMGVGAVPLESLPALTSRGAHIYHVVKPLPDEDKIFEHLRAAVDAGCVAVGMDITPSFGHKAWDEDPTIDRDTAPKTRNQLRGYVEATELPFIIKGVLSVTDALRAQEVGASAIVVSNHGGECIDYSIPILKVLPSIKAAVPEMTLIVDSGFRRGSDVLKALALGADAVGVAQPLVMGYVAAGRVGVQAMMEAITAELKRTMSAVGFGSISEIDDSVLHYL